MKVCSDCETAKDEAEFFRRGRWSEALHPYCRDCHRLRNRRNFRAQRDADPAGFDQRRAARGRRNRWNSRGRTYGLTPGEFDALVLASLGCCGICDAQGDLVVDHDHSSHVVRGLLCSECNLGLGKLGDTLQAVERALVYLR